MSLTSASKVALALGSAAYVDLSAEADGLGAWQIVDTRRTRPIPSLPGVLVIQRLPTGTASATFTVDDNATTHPLLFMQVGKTAKLRVQPFGTKAGLAQTILTGILRTITMSNPPDNARVFSVTLEASAVDDTAQA
ncbi:hypothetical protein [Candidatus Poriferisocius sp.]|uniref:hypothetical protein n=1 Tax=Candidatus Poriferisocius sp. TaxID=3101276 RepID=UPI003B51617F